MEKDKEMLREAHDPFAKARVSRVDTHGLFRGTPPSSVPSPEELGERFRTLRKGAGISRAEAARRVGRSVSSIARFEREGKASASLLLDLIRSMSSATGFVDAFLAPKFSTIREVARHGRTRR